MAIRSIRFGIKAKSPGANLEKKVFGLTDLHHGVSCNGKKLKGKVGGGGVQAVQVDLEVEESLKFLKIDFGMYECGKGSICFRFKNICVLRFPLLAVHFRFPRVDHKEK
ncbi:hypothetical protein DVH24_005159 [Malus domestica]|uniref:Uncharacterized protein n=1 Tax=Malus domestica TaxID=3750 RepID=A0A498IGJ6_MALDO|nr:hypothetical protein DVH24_005159 [Malus domestica]